MVVDAGIVAEITDILFHEASKCYRTKPNCPCDGFFKGPLFHQMKSFGHPLVKQWSVDEDGRKVDGGCVHAGNNPLGKALVEMREAGLDDAVLHIAFRDDDATRIHAVRLYILHCLACPPP